MTPGLRVFLRETIPEIAKAAHDLDSAVTAHLDGNVKLIRELILGTNLPVIREWTESLWGSNSPYVQYRPVHDAPSTTWR